MLAYILETGNWLVYQKINPKVYYLNLISKYGRTLQRVINKFLTSLRLILYKNNWFLGIAKPDNPRNQIRKAKIY